MSADEDTELRDLVAQTLEANGVLGKIRAQLRANVFLALEEQESLQNKSTLVNQELKKYLSTKEGQLVTGLVREFLEHFHLDFTIAVFDPETGLGDSYEGRSRLARELNIAHSGDSKLPLLAEIMRREGKDATTSGTGMVHTEILSPQQLKEARKKFDEYDIDDSGTIEKDELRALFCDVFPNFHRNMLDRYVNDEFRAMDMDFSNTIDFEEFLGMYKRIFISTVGNSVNESVNSPRRLSSGDAPSKIPSLKKIRSTSSLDACTKEDEEIEDKVKSTNNSTSSMSSTSTVESKNKRNLSEKDPTTPHAFTSAEDFFKDDPEDDPFFDDPIPAATKTFSNTEKKESQPTSGSGLSSLAGLPALSPSSDSKINSNSTDLHKEVEAIDKKMAELGFDVAEVRSDENDYEDDDFESSNVSPGRTPRSTRSDHNVKSIDEEIDEDIEEDLSVAEDLLKSDNSGMDDLTTDRTVSPTEHSTVFDYMEDVVLP